MIATITEIVIKTVQRNTCVILERFSLPKVYRHLTTEPGKDNKLLT